MLDFKYLSFMMTSPVCRSLRLIITQNLLLVEALVSLADFPPSAPCPTNRSFGTTSTSWQMFRPFSFFHTCSIKVHTKKSITHFSGTVFKSYIGELTGYMTYGIFDFVFSQIESVV